MHVEIVVKCGKPLMKLRLSTLKYIGIAVALMIVIIFIYCFYLLIFSIQVKTNIGDYVSLINNDGNLLPLATVLPALIGFAVGGISLYLVIRSFNHKEKKMCLNNLLFMFIWVCIAIILLNIVIAIIALTHSYTPHESLHDGIMEAMNKYSYDSDYKRHIDILQVEFQCCGSRKYQEWFDIIWYDTNLIENSTDMSGGETPFSCCSIQSNFPCIHYGIEATGSAYLYSPEVNISISKHGCHEMVLKRKRSVCWDLFGVIMILNVFLLILAACFRIIQTAHHERGKFVEGPHIYTAWIIGCYRGKKRVVKPPPIPPASPEIMDSREW